MPATFAEFIQAPTREVAILVEMTPGVILANWTAVGGATPNVYSIAMPAFVQEHLFPGGVYRPVTGVVENDVTLAQAASLSACNDTERSWFWDAPTGILYVHATGAANPDTFDAYQAVVRFHCANRGLVLNQVDGDPDTGVYYQPWLTGDLPRLASQVEDLLFGVKSDESGAIAFTNGHQFWHTIVAPDGGYVWKNTRVRVFLGGSYNGMDLTRSEFIAHATMTVEDVAANEQACQFQLKPQTKSLQILIPETPFFESEYPALGDGVRGRKKPIGYGRAIVLPALTDTTAHGTYTIADAAYQTLFAVHDVWAVEKTTGARQLLTLTTHYTVDLTACTVNIVDATYTHANYGIEVDVTGKPDGAGSYIKTFAGIVRDLLVTFAGVQTVDIDTAAFDDADLDAPEELSVWLTQPRSLRAILSSAEPEYPSLEGSSLGTVQQTRAGLWTCWIWTPDYDADEVVSLRKEDFKRFEPQPKLESIFALTRVYYAYNPARSEWSNKDAADPRTQYLHRITTAPIERYTFLRNASDAQILAERIQLISGSPSLEIEFEERGALLALELAGNKVLVSYDPAPSASGSFISRPFELLRLERGVAPTVSIVGRFGDLRGIGDRIGVYADDTEPDWASASPEQRSRLCFYADDTGRIDPLDPSTKDRKIYW